MNLKAKVYVENQRKAVEGQLNARLAMLKEKGMDEVRIRKDATYRKLKAELRKADFRLASIAAQEKLNQERAQAKIDKIAAEKAAREAPPEKEAPAEKKEKKPKKEKGEKPAKGEGKAEARKEKGEGKKEKSEGEKEKPEKPKAEKSKEKKPREEKPKEEKSEPQG